MQDKHIVKEKSCLVDGGALAALSFKDCPLSWHESSLSKHPHNFTTGYRHDSTGLET